MSDKVRKQIIFYGDVQGVGFRYRAFHAAQALGITGWVRNEWDGSVSMEVQGTEEEIDQMILTIQKGTYVALRDMKVKTLPLEAEGRFRIR